MRRGISHLTKTSLPSRKPLAIDLELQEKIGSHEGAPYCWVKDFRGKHRRCTDGQEHADYPGGKEEVNTYRVEVLSFDGFEVEDAFEYVRDGDRD